jgi:hypothetical protein
VKNAVSVAHGCRCGFNPEIPAAFLTEVSVMLDEDH